MKDLYRPTVCGKGYFGEGPYRGYNNKRITTSYKVWKHMIERCYDPKSLNKRPTYNGCTVAEEWLNYQTFANWFEMNYVEGFALDKDILNKGNKVYSKETCCFVPHEMNTLFTKSNITRGILPIGVSVTSYGKYMASIKKNDKSINLGYYDTIEEAFQTYKKSKEDYVKEIANKHKSNILKIVYIAMHKYVVEITD